VKFSAIPKPQTREEIQGNCFFEFAGAVETVQAAVTRCETRMILNDVCVLNMPVPVLFSLGSSLQDVGGGIAASKRKNGKAQASGNDCVLKQAGNFIWRAYRDGKFGVCGSRE